MKLIARDRHLVKWRTVYQNFGGRFDNRLKGEGGDGWKTYFSYFKKHLIRMFLNKSFEFVPWYS